MVYQTDEVGRQRRQRTEQAVKLAMQSRWDEAIDLNRQIIEVSGGRDGDAYNRLGRALMALGRYRDSRDAYRQALQIDPNNQIAKKNLAVLEKQVEDDQDSGPADKVDPSLFVEETGKTGITTLQRPNREALQRMTPGEVVRLKRDGNLLIAYNAGDDLIGQIEPRVGLRLIRFMDSGNEYAAAIQQLTHDSARVIIKETYQHPSQVGRISFPSTGLDGSPRPYTREGLVRYDDEDEEVPDDVEPGEGWEADTETHTQGDVTLREYQQAKERDPNDENLYDE